MTSNIIHHDFQNSRHTSSPRDIAAQKIYKARRLMKLTATINSAINTACVFLCGACMAASLLILLSLGLG